MRREVRCQYAMFMCACGILVVGALAGADDKTPSPCAAAPTGCRYGNEQQWIVGEICQDIAEIALFGSTRKKADAAMAIVAGRSIAGTPVYSVSLTGVDSTLRKKMDVQLTDYVWNPVNYEPIAHELLGALPPGSQNTSAGPVIDPAITNLLDLRGTVIETENERISQTLERGVLNPGAHDAAALVLGALALRESAGFFNDPRALMCRMVVHRAIANALRNRAPDSISGVLADAILLTLAGRQRDALEKIETVKASYPTDVALQAWVRALAIRATGDWRLLKNPRGASLLERLECFRARDIHLGSSAATKWLSKTKPEAIPDWGNIVFSWDFSVEAGHMICKTGVPLELSELGAVWRSYYGSDLAEIQLVQSLSSWPEHCVVNEGGKARLRVIAWGTWSGYFQRHLCHQIFRSVYFLRDLWCNDDATREYVAAMESTFSGLSLYPLVAHFCASDKESYLTAMSRGCALCSGSPERVPFKAWFQLRVRSPYAPWPGGLPDENQWFNPGFPFGTAYDSYGRLPNLRNVMHLSVDQLEGLAKEAPFDRDVLFDLEEKKYGEGGSYEELKGLFGRLSDYDSWVMIMLSKRVEDRPEEYQRIMGRLSEWMPDYYITLGQYLADHGMPDEAATAYENAVQKAEDAVHVANNCEWLVDYYYDHGKTNDAERVADYAAEVYSSRGLRTKAHLLERMGQYAEAEGYLIELRDRYDDSGPLAALYQRHMESVASDGVRFSQKSDALAGAIFPSGLQRVTLKDFSTPPRCGALFAESNDRSLKYGLRKGAVVVAVDGYRVETAQQYFFARDLHADNPKMALIVWDGTRYVEVSPEIEGRRFGVKMVDYHR